MALHTAMIHASKDRFLEACGARGPLRLHIDGNGTGFNRDFSFDRPCILVGRDQTNDLCLDHPAISDRHAYLQLVAGNLYCVDLGSQTGLRWEEGFSSSGWLNANEVLKIGPYAIRLAESPTNGHSLNLQPPPEQVVLEFVNARPGSTWTMNRVLTLVGKAPDCAVRLKAPGVADYHCSLLRTPQGLWAVGLERQAGVQVNGMEAPWAALGEGDELAIGCVRMRVRQPVAICPSAISHPQDSFLPNEILMPLLGQFTALQRQMFEQFQQAIYTMVEMFKNMEREQTELIRQEVDRIRDITEELKLLQLELGHHRVVAEPPPARVRHPVERQPARAKPKPVEPPPVSGEPPESTEQEKQIQTWLYDQIAVLQRERESRLKKLINFVSGQR